MRTMSLISWTLLVGVFVGCNTGTNNEAPSVAESFDDPNKNLVPDEVLFIDEPMSTPNGYALTLHGFGTVEFRFRLLAGTSTAKVQFDAGTVQTTPDGSWISVTTTFQQRSRGTLLIECS